MKNFELNLPEGYRPVFEVDAQNKKLVVCFNVIAFAVAIVGIFFACRILKVSDVFLIDFSLGKTAVFVVTMFAYIILHELTHGAAYYALTGHKLKFGITLSVAYCGVPDIFVYRKTAMTALLAPFVVFTLVFALLALCLTDPIYRAIFTLELFIHLGGCVGDLYDTYLYLFKFRDNTTLMQDTGPKQTFYQK